MNVSSADGRGSMNLRKLNSCKLDLPFRQLGENPKVTNLGVFLYYLGAEEIQLELSAKQGRNSLREIGGYFFWCNPR